MANKSEPVKICSVIARRTDKVNDSELFAFAGLWYRWTDPGGQWIRSCSILTTTPNAVTSAVHDRMPVILNKEEYDDLWFRSFPGRVLISIALS